MHPVLLVEPRRELALRLGDDLVLVGAIIQAIRHHVPVHLGDVRVYLGALGGTEHERGTLHHVLGVQHVLATSRVGHLVDVAVARLTT